MILVNAAVVTIEQGTLSGTYLEARNGEKFNAFYGIPFAQPPVGNLRFKVNSVFIKNRQNHNGWPKHQNEHFNMIKELI